MLLPLPRQRDFVKTVHLQFSRLTKNHIEIIQSLSMDQEALFMDTAINKYDLIINVYATGI